MPPLLEMQVRGPPAGEEPLAYRIFIWMLCGLVTPPAKVRMKGQGCPECQSDQGSLRMGRIWIR